MYETTSRLNEIILLNEQLRNLVEKCLTKINDFKK